jgi:hypothetical protein
MIKQSRQESKKYLNVKAVSGQAMLKRPEEYSDERLVILEQKIKLLELKAFQLRLQ